MSPTARMFNVGTPRKLRRRPARIAIHFAWLFCSTAFAQNALDASLCEDFGSYRHIRTTDPARPTGTLRQDNISDEEVREVQQAALEVYPDSIVSISGVTAGCDCEDGSKCTAQVWLGLNRDNRTRSLVLSKIDGHWKIGAVQSWWIQWHSHQASNPDFGFSKQQIAWRQENQRLLDSFPTCPTAPAKWLRVGSSGPRSTCVDATSLQVSEGIRRVYFKTAYPPPLGQSYGSQAKSTIALMAFDCKGHRERIDQSKTYYTDGRVEYGFIRDPVLWDPVRPNTVAAADLELVCAWSSN